MTTLNVRLFPTPIFSLNQSGGGFRMRSFSTVGDIGSVSSPLEATASFSDRSCRGLSTGGGVFGGRPREDSWLTS